MLANNRHREGITENSYRSIVPKIYRSVSRERETELSSSSLNVVVTKLPKIVEVNKKLELETQTKITGDFTKNAKKSSLSNQRNFQSCVEDYSNLKDRVAPDEHKNSLS